MVKTCSIVYGKHIFFLHFPVEGHSSVRSSAAVGSVKAAVGVAGMVSLGWIPSGGIAAVWGRTDVQLLEELAYWKVCKWLMAGGYCQTSGSASLHTALSFHFLLSAGWKTNVDPVILTADTFVPKLYRVSFVTCVLINLMVKSFLVWILLAADSRNSTGLCCCDIVLHWMCQCLSPRKS